MRTPHRFEWGPNLRKFEDKQKREFDLLWEFNPRKWNRSSLYENRIWHSNEWLDLSSLLENRSSQCSIRKRKRDRPKRKRRYRRRRISVACRISRQDQGEYPSCITFESLWFLERTIQLFNSSCHPRSSDNERLLVPPCRKTTFGESPNRPDFWGNRSVWSRWEKSLRYPPVARN